MVELVYKFDEKSYCKGESISKVRFKFFFRSQTYVTGSGKRDIFAHIFKIKLLAPQGRVSSQL